MDKLFFFINRDVLEINRLDKIARIPYQKI